MTDKLKLWFFRDLNDEQRLKLFGLFGLPVDEIGHNHGRQSMALGHITRKLVEMVAAEAAPSPQNHLMGSIPSGWKLVPEEPTEEMIEAGNKAAARAWVTGEHIAGAIIKAALSASPQPVDGGDA